MQENCFSKLWSKVINNYFVWTGIPFLGVFLNLFNYFSVAYDLEGIVLNSNTNYANIILSTKKVTRQHLYLQTTYRRRQLSTLWQNAGNIFGQKELANEHLLQSCLVCHKLMRHLHKMSTEPIFRLLSGIVPEYTFYMWCRLWLKSRWNQQIPHPKKLEGRSTLWLFCIRM